MAHPRGRKEAGRARILASAGRGFRRHGFGGIGVDGLAREAGVTSGAFYAHFRSKSEAFREAVRTGLGSLRELILEFRAGEGNGWLGRFCDFYIEDLRQRDLAESCALQSLSAEVARAGDAARDDYEMALRGVIDAVAAGLPGPDRSRRARAIAVLATLGGGVTLARAVRDPALAAEIAAAVRAGVLDVAVAPAEP